MTQTFLVQNGDILFSGATGRPVLIEGQTKLQQDLKQATEIRTLPNGFGFGLDDVIGLVGDVVSINIEVQRRIRDGITSIMMLQQRFLKAQRTPEEVIAKIDSISVFPLQKPIVGGQVSTAYGFQFGVRTLSNLNPSTPPVTTSGSII